jgi:NodT family efflux transporter outer membrane factor (OMF) lipoprotein
VTLTVAITSPVRWASSWLALVALLSACAGGPTARPGSSAAAAAAPAMPAMPSTWQAPHVMGGPALPTADRSWAGFGDLLPELIAAAQAASPNVSSAAARIAQARATRAAAGAALLPSLDLQAQALQTRTVPLGGPSASAQVGLQSAWEIDLFGGGAAARDAADARLQGAQAGWHDARLAVAAEVASSHVALGACEAQARLVAEDVQSRAETARLTELSANAGFTPPADAALARASAANSRNQLVSQRASCDTLLKSLVELTAIAEPELRQRWSSALQVAWAPPTFTMVQSLPASLLARRPDLVQAERAVLAAAGDRTQTAARERPSLSLSGWLAGGAGRSSGVTVSGAIWSFGPLVVDFPLFDAGRRAANTAAARAAYDDAVVQYRGLARRAVREVEVALVALASATQRQSDAASASRDFEVSVRATAARQRAGLASLFDLEAARRSAVSAQSVLIDLQRERAAAWISLYRALGGGWDAVTLNAAATAP